MKNEFKHTKGPWYVQENVPKELVAGNYLAHFIRETSVGRLIACLWIGGGTKGMPEQLANARLIAAAPDMLEALKRLETLAKAGVIHRNETGKPQWCLTDEIKKIAGEAIAKVKGN